MRFIQAKNYHSGRRSPILRIHIHSMEAPEKGETAESTANYFRTTDKKASAHYCVDSNSEVQCVKDEDTAFHVGNDNSKSLGIEHAGYARQSREEWLDAYGVAMLKRSAKICADLCRRHNIPAKWLDIVDLKENQKGISSHAYAAIAFGGSTHTDPGPYFPKDYYIDLVKNELGEGDDLANITDEEKALLLASAVKIEDLHSYFTRENDFRLEERIVNPLREHDAAMRNSLSGLVREVLGLNSDGKSDTEYIEWLRLKL